jgi:hypothetical protein
MASNRKKTTYLTNPKLGMRLGQSEKQALFVSSVMSEILTCQRAKSIQ